MWTMGNFGDLRGLGDGLVAGQVGSDSSYTITLPTAMTAEDIAVNYYNDISQAQSIANTNGWSDTGTLMPQGTSVTLVDPLTLQSGVFNDPNSWPVAGVAPTAAQATASQASQGSSTPAPASSASSPTAAASTPAAPVASSGSSLNLTQLLQSTLPSVVSAITGQPAAAASGSAAKPTTATASAGILGSSSSMVPLLAIAGVGLGAYFYFKKPKARANPRRRR